MIKSKTFISVAKTRVLQAVSFKRLRGYTLVKDVLE